jgi:hypothetical protein
MLLLHHHPIFCHRKRPKVVEVGRIELELFAAHKFDPPVAVVGETVGEGLLHHKAADKKSAESRVQLVVVEEADDEDALAAVKVGGEM